MLVVRLQGSGFTRTRCRLKQSSLRQPLQGLPAKQDVLNPFTVWMSSVVTVLGCSAIYTLRYKSTWAIKTQLCPIPFCNKAHYGLRPTHIWTVEASRFPCTFQYAYMRGKLSHLAKKLFDTHPKRGLFGSCLVNICQNNLDLNATGQYFGSP